VAGPKVLREYFFASVMLSFGLVLDYLCAIYFGGWLANSNFLTLLFAIACGIGSVFLIVLGLGGLLSRHGRETRLLEDRIVVPGELRFEKAETVIPLAMVWRLYSNLKNDFPTMFLVWKDEKDRCRCTMVDKVEVKDLQAMVARLGERIAVDTDSYAVVDSVSRDVRTGLGCEPAW